MKKFFSSGIGFFRVITFLEGMSLLTLMLIAMPLKYIFDKPEMVSVVGSAHGFLFILFIILALRMSFAYKWGFIKSGLIMASSFVPFGSFVVDHKVLKELHEGLSPA